MSRWSNGCVLRSEKEFNPKIEVKDRKLFKCSECGKPSPYAFKFRGKVFCTATCWMKYYPMTLTGDETRLNEIAEDTAKQYMGRKGKRK